MLRVWEELTEINELIILICTVWEDRYWRFEDGLAVRVENTKLLSLVQESLGRMWGV